METKVIGWLAVASVLFPLLGTVNAQQKELRKIELNVFTADAAVVAARARGLFAEQGVEVKVTVTPNSTDQMRGIGRGLYNIASGSFDNTLAWSGKEGAEIVAVAQTTEGVVLYLFVRPEIKSWNDLRGKKLAADAVDTANALVLRRILLAHGLDFTRGDYELVPVGPTLKRFESVLNRETIATILSPPNDAKAAAAGMVRLGDHREVLPDYAGSVLAANRAWAESHRDDLVRFLRAWMTGIRWVKHPANREEAIKMVSAELKLSPQAAAERVEELSATGSLNVPGIASLLQLRTEFGFKLPMGNSLDRYYDLSYFREAAGR